MTSSMGTFSATQVIVARLSGASGAIAMLAVDLLAGERTRRLGLRVVGTFRFLRDRDMGRRAVRHETTIEEEVTA
jgi:hypothetical protein